MSVVCGWFIKIVNRMHIKHNISTWDLQISYKTLHLSVVSDCLRHFTVTRNKISINNYKFVLKYYYCVQHVQQIINNIFIQSNWTEVKKYTYLFIVIIIDKPFITWLFHYIYLHLEISYRFASFSTPNVMSQPVDATDDNHYL